MTAGAGQRGPQAGAYLDTVFGLAGRTAVVTGGTSGLGAEAARALAQAGADVIVVGRDAERGRQLVGEIVAGGAHADLELADLGDPEAVRALARRILDAHATVDILVNSAGVFLGAEATEVTLADWQRTFDVNVTGTFLMCQAFGQAMLARGEGRIINFASTDAFVGVPEQVAYCASKGAVVQITRTLGAEWVKGGVNVNAIAPCDFATPMVQGLLGDPEYRSWIEQAIPAGRVGRPSEIVGAVLFLASGASSMVAGHTILVDGGRTAI